MIDLLELVKKELTKKDYNNLFIALTEMNLLDEIKRKVLQAMIDDKANAAFICRGVISFRNNARIPVSRFESFFDKLVALAKKNPAAPQEIHETTRTAATSTLVARVV